MRKRNKAYRPRTIRIPMTGFRDMLALHMYSSLVGIESAGDLDSFDSLANIINMIGLAMADDARLAHQFRLVQGGASAMNDIGRLLEAGLTVQERHTAPVRVAIGAIDSALPRMDVSKIYLAEKTAVALLRVQRAQTTGDCINA